MNQLGITYIKSDKDSHFTGALIENAIESEDLNYPTDWRIAQINEILIKGITIQADQNLEWDIFLWSKESKDNTDLDVDTFVDFINFPSTIGKQIAGSNQYYYSLSNLSIPYEDIGKQRKLHCSIVNRSSTAKLAGGTGEVVVSFAVSPVTLT